MKQALQYFGWPVISGILLALVLMQFQQMQRIQERLATQPAAQSDPAAPQLAGQAMVSFADAIARAAPAVVSIHSTIREQIQLPPVEEIPPALQELLQNIPAERLWESLGSGVVISDSGHILTALHVIEGAEDIEVHFNHAQQGGVTARASIVGTDPSTDLALLLLDSPVLPPAITTGSSDGVRVGDAVLTIGYPRRDLITQKSVSLGIVSALGIPRDGLPVVEYIQTDADMSYGHSGGALVNSQGELIGINSFIYSESGESDGMGFAVPVNKAMIVVEHLIQYGEVTSGYLGVITGEMLTPETSSSFFGNPDISGLLVEQVNADSPAEHAGLRAGDVMSAIDGQTIRSVLSAIEQINRKAPGQTVELTVFREGAYRDISVMLGTGTAQYRTQPADRPSEETILQQD